MGGAGRDQFTAEASFSASGLQRGVVVAPYRAVVASGRRRAPAGGSGARCAIGRPQRRGRERSVGGSAARIALDADSSPRGDRLAAVPNRSHRSTPAGAHQLARRGTRRLVGEDGIRVASPLRTLSASRSSSTRTGSNAPPKTYGIAGWSHSPRRSRPAAAVPVAPRHRGADPPRSGLARCSPRRRTGPLVVARGRPGAAPGPGPRPGLRGRRQARRAVRRDRDSRSDSNRT